MAGDSVGWASVALTAGRRERRRRSAVVCYSPAELDTCIYTPPRYPLGGTPPPPPPPHLTHFFPARGP